MTERQTILIVDDRKENLVALRRVLSDLDVEIVEATNGNEALAATIDRHFAVAILDVQMPGMSGYELAEHLRGDDTTKVIPLVFVTASFKDEQSMFQGYDAGGVDYIVKPYDPKVLLSKVKVFLELDRHRRELRRRRDSLQSTVSEQTARLRHLNNVLRAIRNVNQLIVHEKDPETLLNRACELLVESRSYIGACVALTGTDAIPPLAGSAGLNKGFECFTANLTNGWVPPCSRDARAKPGTVVRVPAAHCTTCPLFKGEGGHAVAAELVHGGHAFGVLSITLDPLVSLDDEESSLIQEVAADIAFALHAIMTTTAMNRATDEIRRFQWLLDQETIPPTPTAPAYGDITELNTERTILDGVGADMLRDMAADAVALLDTSVAIYERNGDHAFDMFVSEWCGMMNNAARQLCGTTDNREALRGGKWLCHESCWNDSAKAAIASGEPTDIACVGGIRLFAAPIKSGGEVIGAVNIGYGIPPRDDATLAELAARFGMDIHRVRKAARGYKPRPPFIIEMAKRRVLSVANMIGEIVERKQASAALCRSEQLLSFAIEQMPVPVIVASAPDVTITRYNQAVVDMLAVEPADVRQIRLDEHRTFWPTFHPDGTPYRIEDLPLTQAVREGKVTRGREIIVRHGDGDRWIAASAAPLYNDAGEIVAGIVVFPEITEKKKVESALRAAERRNQALLDYSPVCHQIVDIDFNLQYMSKSGFRMLRLDEKADVYGKPYPFAFFPEAFRQAMKERLNEVKVTGEVRVIEAGAKDGQGNDIWLHSTLVPVPDDNGAFDYITVVSADLTAEKRLERDLRQSDKLNAVGQLAGGVAHDFNNLLMGIMNYVELCRDALETDHPVHEWLDEITQEAQRSADIVRQLLAFSRRQTIAPRVLDLNDTVAGMLKMLRRLIGEDIDLLWQPGAELGSIKMDPGQVDQILANLCVNARDAISGVGKITIETTHVMLDAHGASRLDVTPGTYTILAVSDTGVGMDAATRDKVFEPFFTTKADGKGTGLGLATVYGIVKQNGGTVTVYSEPGTGTTFRIYLPCNHEDVDERPQADETSETPGGTETVLLVEDEKSIRVTTRMFLEQLGYTVLAAETPGVALETAASWTEGLDILLTDVVMPGMNGRELAEKLKADHHGLKVLYMSGYTANAIAHRGVLDQGVNFLSKPITIAQLARKVREILDA